MTEITKEQPILQHPSKDELLQDVPADVNDFRLKHWDKGIFSLELHNLAITAPTKAVTNGSISDEVVVSEGQVKEGTYHGTRLAITEIYNRIESRLVNLYFSLVAGA